MSSSVGMMKFPIYGEKNRKCSKPPTSNSLFVNSLQYILFGFYHVLSLLLLAEIHMFVANKGPTLLLARQSRQKLQPNKNRSSSRFHQQKSDVSPIIIIATIAITTPITVTTTTTTIVIIIVIVIIIIIIIILIINIILILIINIIININIIIIIIILSSYHHRHPSILNTSSFARFDSTA